MSRYAFQSPAVSNEKGPYRMHRPRTGSSLRHPSDPPGVYLHLPYRRTRRLAILVAFLACSAFVCFAYAYWLFSTRYSHLSPPVHASSPPLNRPRIVDAPRRATFDGHSIAAPYQDPSHQPLDITIDILDEPDIRLDELRPDTTTTYIAYLPHSGLHNQRIALENAITLARLLNRTLLVPPARLGPKTLRYVRSSELARMLQLSDKRVGRAHCAYTPVDVPMPYECADYMAYTLVPWAWLVDLRPIEGEHAHLVRVSNGSAAWIEGRLGVGPNETLFLHDTEPYEYQFVDTPAPGREGNKYLRTISIDTLVTAPQRLIQLGTLFGSSRLRLRRAENRRVRGQVRRQMVLANVALMTTAERIGEALGGTYIAAHVRVGDGHFQRGARANVRLIWWKLIQVLSVDMRTALWLERRVFPGENQGDGGRNEDEGLGPPEILPDVADVRVPHPPLPRFGDVFLSKLPCRGRLPTQPYLCRLNVPLFIATDALGGLDNPLLAPLVHTFPCTFTLGSFEVEMSHLEALWNGYDGVGLSMFVVPLVDGLVMGRAWGVVGTEGSTFSRYVEDVLWRVSHGFEIVERGS